MAVSGTTSGMMGGRGGGPPAAGQATNTVRIHGAELKRLLSEMDATAPPQKGPVKRSHSRWPFRVEGLRVELLQAEGGTTVLRLAARNLSSTGMGLLHSTYVHTGTRCIAHLPTIDGGALVPAPGTVVRCQHHRGVIHEVGVRFDKRIDPRQFVPVDPMEGGFTLEKVDPKALDGTLLHVDESAMDRRLLSFALAETRLVVSHAESGAEALIQAAGGFHLVVCEMHLPDMTGAELIGRLREQGVTTPVLVLTADDSRGSRLAARAAGAAAFLAKPMTPAMLLRAAGEVLLAGGSTGAGEGPLHSALPEDDPARELVAEFVGMLARFAQAMREAMGRGDAESVRKLAMQLKGSAPALGFAPIGAAAESLLGALGQPGGGGALRELRTLVGLCNRARGSSGDFRRVRAA